MQNVTDKKSIYDVKRKACVSKDKYLLASDSIKKTKKQKQLLKNKLNASRKESCCIKQDIKTSLDTLKECKKESIKTSEKHKNDRASQVINDLKRHNKRINQLNTKHSNSTNISTLKRLRNETEEYMNKTRKYRDEMLHIVNISNLSSKTCINVSTQVDIDCVNVDTDFDSTKSCVNESTQVDIDFVNVCTQTEIKSDDVSTQVDDDDKNDDNNDSNHNNDDNNDSDDDDDEFIKKDKQIIKRDKQIIKRDKPDRSDNVECMPCNVIIREVPSIDEYKRGFA